MSKVIYKGSKCSKEMIYEKVLQMLTRSCLLEINKCVVCDWIDFEDNLIQCHVGSENYCCNDCIGDAKNDKKKICEECSDVDSEEEEEDSEAEEESNNNSNENPKNRGNVQQEVKGAEDSNSNENSELKDNVQQGSKDKEINSSNLDLKHKSNVEPKSGDSNGTLKCDTKQEFHPEEADPKVVIDHLREILFQLKAPLLTCNLCNWIDVGENIKECHPGSHLHCCDSCTIEAQQKGLSLCRESCSED